MNFSKIKKTFYIMLGIFAIGFGRFVFAQPIVQSTRDELRHQTEEFRFGSGFGTGATIANITKAVIQGFLGLLGIIFVILMIVAGYNWMTAGGDEEKLTTAKKMISRAIYGLIITVFAYAITYFVFSSLPVDVGGGGGGPVVTP